jgi:phage baseplate assembly protein V
MGDTHDTTRLVGDIARYGVIVSRSGDTCRVQVGDLVTGDVPWISGRAGSARVWSPPSVGEQCLLLCPEGDAAAGVVLPGIFSDANPAPADDDAWLVTFEDGTRLRYDPAAHALEAILATGGSATIDAPGGITLRGPVTVEGTLTASEDVVAAGKSLKDHVHLKVQPGAGISGAPQ